ncbi:hypothetical protein F2P56_012927 [Juglans regia]|uniref:Uncharacterized protein LOC108993901 n=2 Tax=Juglans regia TaxID=51240 RepID=A0A2I4EYN5_JUGRE|nr:uncharacterized protein LOC108993901 [Juglans regia]KAF5468807.1 hypothetical protein F2P56_012927 [Juglans regia]
MDDLENKWEKLRLSEEEALNIDFGDDIGDENLERLHCKEELSLVGKIWVGRSINQAVVESTMAKVWKISKRAKFKGLGDNVYVMVFANQADKQRILEGRPWLFDNQLFVIMQYDGFTPPSKINFKRECFWIQMHELPLICMNKVRGEIIGGTVGRVKEVDTQEDGCGWGEYLRVLIEVDLEKPLARGRSITVRGKHLWTHFKFEKLPHICFSCGCILHREQGCIGTGEGEGQYGVWLRAGFKGKKERGGSSSFGFQMIQKEKTEGGGRENILNIALRQEAREEHGEAEK